jgi:hypothetical protein
MSYVEWSLVVVAVMGFIGLVAVTVRIWLG